MRIGSTFRDECIAAGAPTDGYSCNAETGDLFFNEDVPEEARAAVEAVLAAHDPAPALAGIQTSACTGIDAHAESLRLTVLTPGTGQMAAYQRKEARARAYLDDLAAGTVPADAVQAAAEYPALYGEVGITADTPEGVARVVVANADAWYAYGDAIERARLAGKRAVATATDATSVDAAVAAIIWPSAATNSGS